MEQSVCAYFSICFFLEFLLTPECGIVLIRSLLVQNHWCVFIRKRQDKLENGNHQPPTTFNLVEGLRSFSYLVRSSSLH